MFVLSGLFALSIPPKNNTYTQEESLIKSETEKVLKGKAVITTANK